MSWATTQAGRFGDTVSQALLDVQVASNALATTTQGTAAYWIAKARYDAASGWLTQAYADWQRLLLEKASRDDGGA